MDTEIKQQYEGAILNQLIKNSERLVIVEKDLSQLKVDVITVKSDLAEMKPKIDKIDETLNWIKWLLGAIAIGILGNIFSQPVLAALHLI